ncbi:MAG: protein kinase [Polyangiaceae bacterium]|nr:protein kinase [Polyangiaceae bacterium]MCW5791845.1 protein kinase [Polyangiaceae bacterium]
MTTDEHPPDPLIGALIDRKYRVERLLGRGGMGSVYEATHVAIGKRVALKFLAEAEDRDAVRRFQREAEAASAVESAHIVQIFDSGTTEDDRPYLVMELLRGEDLRERINRLGRLSEAEVLHITAQTLRALIRAHAAGIVHRDLKPDNLFLSARDDDSLFVKVVDFGISKVVQNRATPNTLTRHGTVLGTAYYMAPEQAQAFPDIDGRADLYSLGAICFEALTGQPPHDGRTYEAILVKACTQDAPDPREHVPEISEAFARVIRTALARERSERFATAQAFLDALAEGNPDIRTSGAPVPSYHAVPREASSASLTSSGSVVPTLTARPNKSRLVVTAMVASLAAFVATALWLGRPTGTPSGAAASDVSAPIARTTAPSATVAGTALSGTPTSDAAPSIEPIVTPDPSASAHPAPQAKPRPRPTPRPSQPTPQPTPKPGGLGLNPKEP